MDIVVTPFGAADHAAVERAYQIEAAAIAVDVPDFPPLCRQRFAGGINHPMPGKPQQHALAYLDGVPVGHVEITLPQLDNTENAWVGITVHPRHRRRGAGRALHEYTVRRLRDQGRKRVIGEAVSPLPGGPPRDGAGNAFAAAMRAEAALADVRRRLDVTALDQAGLDRLLHAARARAEGYLVVRWRGPTPEEYLDDVAYLDGRLLADAPMGDLAQEPERVDAARVRAVEAVLAARGRRTYHCGARHEATGRLVALTVLDVGASTPWHAFQQITLVDPGHRGHRLGTIVKIENLRYARAHEPELRAVDTWNAAVNDHMISINEAMGFRPVDGGVSWQLAI